MIVETEAVGQPYRQAAQDRGRWCYATWDRPQEGWFYISLSVDRGPQVSTNPQIPRPGEEEEWAGDVATALCLSLVRRSLLASLDSPTEEQEQEAFQTALRVSRETRNRLTALAFTEEQRTASAERWGIDADTPEAGACLFLEVAVSIAAELLAREGEEALAAELGAVATWLRGGELQWPNPPLTCPECGKEFLPRQRNQRFCSVKCSQKVRTREAKRRARQRSKELSQNRS